MANVLRSVLGRVLRFLNTLEPGKTILSLSKSAVWIALVGTGACIWGAVYVILRHPEHAAGIITALAALAGVFNLPAFGNYAFRRKIQHDEGGVK